MRRRPGVLAALLLLLPLLVAGCVRLPSSGPVRSGLPVAEQGEDEFVRPVVDPPAPGMNQVEVVEGFLAASAAVGEDYQVARMYLAPSAARDWQPGAGVTVFREDALRLQPVGQNVEATATAVAAIDAAGVPAEVEAVPLSHSYEMVVVDGQWRIGNPPPGLILSESDVARSYSAANAYFMEPGGNSVVPDPRLLPRTGSLGEATALANALLAGPSSWLAPGVRTALPADARLSLGAVPVTDGVARVDLEGSMSELDETTRSELGAQLAWTLSQVPGVDAVDVTVRGISYPVAEGRGAVPLSDFAQYDPDVLTGSASLYGVDGGGRLVEFLDEGLMPLRPDQPDPPAGAVAVSPAGPTVALATQDGAGIATGSLRRPGEPLAVQPTQVVSGPSIDQLDRVWWVAPGGRVLVSQPVGDGTYAPGVDTNLSGVPGEVIAMRLSRDGVRAAAVVRTAAGTAGYLAVVSTGDNGLVLQNWRPLASSFGLEDIAWRSADTLTGLVSPEGELARWGLLGEQEGDFAGDPAAATVTDAPADSPVLGLPGSSSLRITGAESIALEGLLAPAFPG